MFITFLEGPNIMGKEIELAFDIPKEVAESILSSVDVLKKKSIYQSYLFKENAIVGFCKETNVWKIELRLQDLYYPFTVKPKSSEVGNIHEILKDITHDNLACSDLEIRIRDYGKKAKPRFEFTVKKLNPNDDGTDDGRDEFEAFIDWEHLSMLDAFSKSNGYKVIKKRNVFMIEGDEYVLDQLKQRKHDRIEIEFDTIAERDAVDHLDIAGHKVSTISEFGNKEMAYQNGCRSVA